MALPFAVAEPKKVVNNFDYPLLPIPGKGLCWQPFRLSLWVLIMGLQCRYLLEIAIPCISRWCLVPLPSGFLQISKGLWIKHTTRIRVGAEDSYPRDCVEVMSQSQISVPMYNRPSGVADERRNARTPPPPDDEDPPEADDALGVELVSDHPMPEQELRAVVVHGRSGCPCGGASLDNPPGPPRGDKLYECLGRLC
jgi:hypothetical protein